jgi:HPt (histidine-containing phosphotransfer) domain-containing protein
MATKSEIPPPLDRERLLAECDDEQSFVNQCLQIFVRDAQADLKGISIALARNDFPQIARLAHRIKGASASIRADFLRQQAAHLETLGSKQELCAAEECFTRLQIEFEEFKNFISIVTSLPE